jgi:hypothetical protein
MFYFQQLLNQGLAGIDRMSLIPAVTGIAYTVLLIGFLIGIYSAAMRGGDLQSLGVAAIKYLVIAIILANWSMVFREVNNSFFQVAQFIRDSSGAGDVFTSWLDQLKQQFDSSGSETIWALISGAQAAAITVLLTIVAYIIYVVALIVFGFFYTLYGCVLYVLGPLVLALLPIPGVGQLAKTFATNVMIWNSWAILYGILGALISAIQANRISGLTSFVGFFTGTLDSTLLGLISIFYALALMLIPFIAKKIITGDVGSSASALVRAAATAAGVAFSAGAGLAAGAGAGAAAGTGPASAAGSGAGVSGSSASTMSSSAPPPQPNLAHTISSGIKSAVTGGAPPPPNGSASQGANHSGSSSPGAASTTGNSSSSGFQYRPQGVMQTLAFHAGRMTGQAMKGRSETQE